MGAVAGNPRVIIDALAKETSVRVVSSPSVVVLHNQPATLQVGDEVPIIDASGAERRATPNSPVVNEIQYKNTGVILKVTPRINSNGLVTMDIEQEISAVTAHHLERNSDAHHLAAQDQQHDRGRKRADGRAWAASSASSTTATRAPSRC